MEKEIIEYIPVEQCKTEGQFVKAICFKPKTAPIVVGIVGLLLMIPNNMVSRLLGIFLFLIVFAVIKLVKDFKVMDIFDKGIMIYGDEEAKTAFFVSFDEMESWDVKHENGHDTVEFVLNDGRTIIKDTFEADKVYRALMNLVREKDLSHIKALKDRETPLSVPEAFKNIKNAFKKK